MPFLFIRLFPLSLYICLRVSCSKIKRGSIGYSTRCINHILTKRIGICRNRGTHTWGMYSFDLHLHRSSAVKFYCHNPREISYNYILRDSIIASGKALPIFNVEMGGRRYYHRIPYLSYLFNLGRLNKRIWSEFFAIIAIYMRRYSYKGWQKDETVNAYFRKPQLIIRTS